MSIAEKLKTVAANMTLLINKAKERGVYEWWHAYQTQYTGEPNECDRLFWSYAFAGDAWDNKVYKPISDREIVILGSSNYMYANSAITDTQVTINIERASGAGTAHTFRDSSLITIPKLKVSEITDMATQFRNCEELKSITIEGVVGKDANFQWCPLTYESAESVLRALKNFNTPNNYDSMFTCTVQFSDETWELLDNIPPVGTIFSTWRDYLTYIGWNT